MQEMAGTDKKRTMERYKMEWHTIMRALADEARGWQATYRARGQQIEAAACAIRVKALLDATKALAVGHHSPTKGE